MKHRLCGVCLNFTRPDEIRCPFCGSALPVVSRWATPARMGAVAVLGVGLALSGCSQDADPAGDAGAGGDVGGAGGSGGSGGHALQQRAAKPTICFVCSACRAVYFLEPMLIEPGLGTSLLKRDHLASDEPNEQLTSPT